MDGAKDTTGVKIQNIFFEKFRKFYEIFVRKITKKRDFK
jgi:hypothetical protein